jgi:hypothetical protein
MMTRVLAVGRGPLNTNRVSGVASGSNQLCDVHMRWQVLNDHLAAFQIDAHMDDPGRSIDRSGHMPHARAARHSGHAQGRCLDLTLGRWLLPHTRSTQSGDGHFTDPPPHCQGFGTGGEISASIRKIPQAYECFTPTTVNTW